MRKPVWSFSALSSYELCPKKYHSVSIAKTHRDPPNTAGDYGTAGHKHFENYLRDDTALPLDLAHHKTLLDKCKAMNGTKLYEQKIGITSEFAPTGFFDTDVWGRGVIDFVAHTEDDAFLVDWKFGKFSDNTDQLSLSCAMLSCILPTVKRFHALYYYAKDKARVPLVLNREDLVATWNTFLPRITAWEEAFKQSEFPAKKNFLCRSWCGVKSCPHNGI